MRKILFQDVKFIKGVGDARAKMLDKELGIRTLGDLIQTYPYRYDDRTRTLRISDLMDGMPNVQIKAEIVDFFSEGMGRKKRLKATVFDGYGYAEIVWFAGLKFIEKNYKIGQKFLIFGTPKYYNRRFSFAHPEMTLLNGENPPQLSALTPHYHTTERMKNGNFSSKALAQVIRNAFELLKEPLEETLTPDIVSHQHLMPLDQAVRAIHQPKNAEEIAAASRRLKFDELFFLQLGILKYTQNRKENVAGYVLPKVGPMFNRFFNERLPFELTGAQKRVLHEIHADVRSGRQMNRLVQGDVGSGKTMVALMSCLLAIDNGFQSCLMAPTEILAEQHYATLKEQIGELPVRVELLTGIVKGKKRREILEAVANGEVDILVGTHALIEPTVSFLNLGLAVIDEQHRFGVKQRAMLWQKNAQPPHILVMTATPIPRTLAMTVYGDLDVSVIDELPPGRKPISTRHFYNDERGKMFNGMVHELQLGRQIYVVFPLIEESEKADLQSLEEGYRRLVEQFPSWNVGYVHGRMKPAEKEEAMQKFIRREMHILVSTTVIEVGVNVPNASVMIIEEAQRFGLAQLHQLRGRVGRGADQSYCLLVTPHELAENTRRRMKIMVESTDGFEIAEEDLKLRGPGDLEGTQQSGLPFDLRIANIVRDSYLLQICRQWAQKVIDAEPAQYDRVWQHLRTLRKDKKDFSEIS